MLYKQAIIGADFGKGIFMAIRPGFKVMVLAGLAAFALAVLPAGCDEEENSTSANKVEKKTVTNTARQTGKETKMVKLETSMGDIIVELNEQDAPVTVKNFLKYVEEGFYDGTIFHRVIPNFMIQGGGFTADMAQKQTHPPITNEAANGLKNDRGTLVMARTNNPNSATSQFFINHQDNDSLNYRNPSNPGYTVFGKVIEGMEVLDAIAAVKTTRKGQYSDVPAKTVMIKSASVISETKGLRMK